MPLAPYAVSDATSRGRAEPVAPSKDRNEFQRDYTRILHSQALRRLQYKTQVFGNNEGDFFRTRLTHSMEVEQISRSVARQLYLNEDLAGTLAIGHDLGHPPFGHLGQDVLNELMKDHGGFEHNLQALRIVDLLESPYPHHQGLNLMFETREGLLKHCSATNARMLGDVAARHLSKTMPPLEVEVVDHCDAIAYVHADLEDAFTMGVLSPELMRTVPGYEAAWQRVQEEYPGMDHPTSTDMASGDYRRVHIATTLVKTAIRSMLSAAVSDLTATSMANILRADPKNLDDVRHAGPLVGFSPEHDRLHKELKRFSRQNIYNHPRVLDARRVHEEALRGIFTAYAADPSEMSGKGVNPDETFHRSLADHIAGMTDRYAMAEYKRLLVERPDLVRQTSTTASMDADLANETAASAPRRSRGPR